jgi:membrane-associated protease RseP (regulator of RpoE activity)
MTILSIHELGHYLAARFYKVRTTLPYFMPIPFFLGTFGAFIQMRSPIPNRKALFDVGIAGPLAGFIVTLPFLIWGLAHSDVVPLSEASRIFNFESLNPRFSLLLTLLGKLALGSQLTAQTAIKLHPVAIAGYVGLIVTALNLIPVGQLDGGHIVHAMFGQRTGAAIGQITRLLVLLLALLEKDLLLWAIILLFMPVADEPALNDVSELDNWRDFWGILALVILVSIVLPAPARITGLLNI